MGPFVPDIISDQLNLVVALLLGIAFGFVLEQAGFSSSRRLAGVFYGYDFTVLRVFFTAAITAMIGVILLGYFGLLDASAIYVNPTWMAPAIVGGIIMGVGFLLGGYCPGTSVCAAAIGKIDAMWFIGGGLLGVFIFGEFYPLYHTFYESTSMGSIKVFDSLGISQGTFAFLLIVIAVGMFALTSRLEKKVDAASAPALSFHRYKHFSAAAGVLVLGFVILLLPDRKTHLLNEVSSPEYISSHPVTAMDKDELAFRIVDAEPNIRIIDIRSPKEFSQVSLPGSLNVQIKELFGKDWNTVFSRRHIEKVFLGNSEADERTAFLLTQELGYENLAILKGGFSEFSKTYLQPSPFIPTGSRWDPQVKEFRENASADILRMIQENKNKKPREAKATKKIQGGC